MSRQVMVLYQKVLEAQASVHLRICGEQVEFWAWPKTSHTDKQPSDMLQEFNVDSKAECGQLNVAHVARNKSTKETKTNKRQCPLSSVQIKICEGRSKRIDVSLILSQCNVVVSACERQADLPGHYGSHTRPQVADWGTPSRSGTRG